jgi:uncharacterized protein (TIGR02996 family)
MTHEDAFLQTIVESPAEDGPRLVYADWLEDHDQGDRAEFIRVQIELAGLSERNARRWDLEEREWALLRQHERKWLGPLRAWLSKWEFRRGLVEGVSLKAQSLLKQADTLFRLAPVRHAEVHRAGKCGRALAECPPLGRLTSLHVHGLYTSDSTYLITSEHLGGLTSLGLPQSHLTDAGVEVLAASLLLARLSRLDLTCNSVHDEGVRALAESPHASGLTWLDLSRNWIGDAGAAALAASAPLTGLRSLRLSRIWRGERAMELLRTRFGERISFC